MKFSDVCWWLGLLMWWENLSIKTLRGCLLRNPRHSVRRCRRSYFQRVSLKIIPAHLPWKAVFQKQGLSWKEKTKARRNEYWWKIPHWHKSHTWFWRTLVCFHGTWCGFYNEVKFVAGMLSSVGFRATSQSINQPVLQFRRQYKWNMQSHTNSLEILNV